MTADARNLQQRSQELAQRVGVLRAEIQRVILGQDRLIDDLLTALLAGGHVLLEGLPGLGKTRLVRTLADCLGLAFARIQFTPDLMPADVTGTRILDSTSAAANGSSGSSAGRCSPTCCSPTRSIGPPPRPSRRCSRPCRKAR
jgi:MoxR-like ATPase